MEQFVVELTKHKRKGMFGSRSNRKEEKFETELLHILKSSSDLKSVVTEVGKLNTEFEARPQHVKAVKEGFRGLCEHIDGFSSLLKLFPTDNMYTSTLCGALRLIVKASLPHILRLYMLVTLLADISQLR